MLLTENHLASLAGKKMNENMVSTMSGLKSYGVKSGLDIRANLAQYLAQVGHESAGFRYDREIVGPTATQLRYEGRKDLGNVFKGDGLKFVGRTAMQITGRYNTTKFYDWCVSIFGKAKVPDFTKHPELMNTDPWEGLGPIWYWTVGNPLNTNLNKYAIAGDLRKVTRLINGGYNGLNDRYRYYGRAAMMLLGYEDLSVRQVQKEHGLVADNVCGPKTAALLHQLLLKQPKVKFIIERNTTFDFGELFKSILNWLGIKTDA